MSANDRARQGGREVPADADPVVRLRKIVRCLRAPGGCPWDREQTHQSLIPNLLEEAYEAAAALRTGGDEEAMEELGDLLLQVVMHAEIAAESQRYTLEEIATVVAAKLVRRHPHVFGDSEAADTEAVLTQWEAIKRQEKGDEQAPYLKGAGEGLPALMTAHKLQKRAAKVGFDWPSSREVLEKVKEELAETEEALKSDDPAPLREEIGDLLFSVVNLARKAHLDSEDLLAAANEKFIARFGAMEHHLRESGVSLERATLEEMDAAWEHVKKTV